MKKLIDNVSAFLIQYDIENKLRYFITGKSSLTGENIIDKEPTFRICKPTEDISFNDWTTQFKVSSRVPKVRTLIKNQYI